MNLFSPTWRTRSAAARDSGMTPGANPGNPEKPPEAPFPGYPGAPQDPSRNLTSSSSTVPPSVEGPTDQLDRDGYLLVRSRVLDGRLVLVVLDLDRVPEDLLGLPRFDLAEIDQLLTLSRDDARELLRTLLAVKETLGGTLESIRPSSAAEVSR